MTLAESSILVVFILNVVWWIPIALSKKPKREMATRR